MCVRAFVDGVLDNTQQDIDLGCSDTLTLICREHGGDKLSSKGKDKNFSEANNAREKT
jgi:hypothetical protein